MEDTKAWYTSKTIWVNVVALMGSVLFGFGVELTADQQNALVSSILAVVNIILRFATTKGITKK